MKYTTRFNPTVNGPLHLGHLYTILINQAEAKRSGGKFGIRFDDTQRYWNFILGAEKVAEYKAGMIADLEWLGIQPDFVDHQSLMMPQVEALLRDEFRYEPTPQPFGNEPGAELAGCSHHFYPYTDRLTAEKVVMDLLELVTWLIRGMDLISEDCLYKHFAAKFGLWIPRTSYLPRLACGVEISKTSGNYKIQDFRAAGFDPQELLAHLAADCLIGTEWAFEQIKQVPTLGTWAEEALHGFPF